MLTIVLAGAAIGAGFLAAAISPLTEQAAALARQLPHYLHSVQDHNSQLCRLDTRFHVEQRVSSLLSTRGTQLIGGVLGAGAVVLSALLDLIPVIGSTIAGAIVSLVALAVSIPVALATLGFYIGYRLAEDYLLVPRIIGRTVHVPAVVSVVAVRVGGALMGIVGALVAIPAAAAVRLLLHEVAFRRLDTS